MLPINQNLSKIKRLQIMSSIQSKMSKYRPKLCKSLIFQGLLPRRISRIYSRLQPNSLNLQTNLKNR